MRAKEDFVNSSWSHEFKSCLFSKCELCFMEPKIIKMDFFLNFASFTTKSDHSNIIGQCDFYPLIKSLPSSHFYSKQCYCPLLIAYSLYSFCERTLTLSNAWTSAWTDDLVNVLHQFKKQPRSCITWRINRMFILLVNYCSLK